MIQRFLEAVYNLFSLGGVNGGIAVRQKGGTSGTHELWIYEDGSSALFDHRKAGSGYSFLVNGSAVGHVVGNGGFSAAGSANSFSCNGGGFVADGSVGVLRLGSAWPLVWNADAAMSRVAAGVLRSTDTSGTTLTWLQNTPGRSRLTADVTNVTTTLANLTDLTMTVKAGRKYTGRLVLIVNNALAADGFKFDLNGGTATMTSIQFGFSAAMAATVGTRTSNALATAITLTALADTNNVILEIPVSFVVNGAGTVIPRQAKNADAAGATLTTLLNSFFWLEDTP